MRRTLVPVAAGEAAVARAGVLDTQAGSGAEHVHRCAGRTGAGTIPDHATEPQGRLHPTTLFRKHPAPPR
ncbi:hypothetical protein AB0F11_28610 [Streptomyces sp. NPDC032472]|uniref:hypothetical protein n=1 Tax=Streptomyces sp. NPDC032472 TaxID=3155018 RepID=UPI00340A93F3